jgi:hypothetical protein
MYFSICHICLFKAHTMVNAYMYALFVFTFPYLIFLVFQLYLLPNYCC